MVIHAVERCGRCLRMTAVPALMSSVVAKNYPYISDACYSKHDDVRIASFYNVYRYAQVMESS